MALAPLSQTILLTEDGSIIPVVDPVMIPVAVVVSLRPLSLSGPLRLGVVSSGTIGGATDGSTITEAFDGLTIDRAALTYAFDGNGTAGIFDAGLIETHPRAVNSGRESPVTILAAAPVITIGNTASNSALLASQVSGYSALLAARQARLAPLEAAAGIAATPFDLTKTVAFNEALTDARLTVLEERAARRRPIFSDPFFTDPFFRDAA